MKVGVRGGRGLWLSLGAIGQAMFAVTTSAQDVGQASGTLEEIVVTSQRREEKISDVPLSISAFSQERLDAQGVRSIDEIARLTPGITFSRADQRNGAASNISIRGISSTAGTSTTGIYIDDTPIQIRTLGYASFNTFPQVFDIERVEVLRGPQGTLFGAGSEGGTVRFITPEPNLTRGSTYVRSEVGYTEGGEESYEAGAAFGGPIVADKLAVRVSTWYRQDGGWVDHSDWSRATRTPTQVIDDNSNRQNSTVARVALSYAPTEALRIVPSVYYQKLELNDTPFYWASLSNSDDYVTGNALNATNEDRFYLPALKVQWDVGAVSLVSNTSYFNRNNEAVNDYSAFEAGLWARNPYFPEGFFAPTRQINQQNNFTQELRVQSGNPDSRWNWVAGAFYSHARQTAKQFVQDTFLPDLFEAMNGVPFEAVFGQGLVDGLYTFVAAPIIARDEQVALYSQVDFDATDKLTLTLALRGSQTKVEASAQYRGPVVGPAVSDAGSQEESPVTPKAGVSYKFNDDNMMYATAAKGFRIGGYNPRVGLPCGNQLASLGLTEVPQLFDSDSVWSYEIGAKNTLADGRVQVNASVYHIDWQDIQQQVTLNTCGFNFVTNLGSATSQGMDVQLQLQPLDSLTIDLAVGYTDAEYDETVKAGPAAARNLVTKGDKIAGSPWNLAAAMQYEFGLGSADGYARFDYQYRSRQTDLVAANNPQNGTYNPVNVFLQPEQGLLSFRFGARWSGLDVSLFANNVLDDDTVLARDASQGMPTLYREITTRPRSYGVTATYRY